MLKDNLCIQVNFQINNPIFACCICKKDLLKNVYLVYINPFIFGDSNMGIVYSYHIKFHLNRK